MSIMTQMQPENTDFNDANNLFRLLEKNDSEIMMLSVADDEFNLPYMVILGVKGMDLCKALVKGLPKIIPEEIVHKIPPSQMNPGIRMN